MSGHHNDSPLYLFSGGGSGGHLIPGIAVADELCRRQPHARVLFVGSSRLVETTILKATPYEHVALDPPASRDIIRRPFRFVKRWFVCKQAAQRLLIEREPTAVIGLGGFASIPVASQVKRRCPLILLEQNAVPGRATTLLAPKADLICASLQMGGAYLPKPNRRPRIVLTGNPVRKEIAALMHSQPDVDPQNPLLLILGGSQGSGSLNEIVSNSFPPQRQLLDGWRILHQTGSGGTKAQQQLQNAFGERYQSVPYIHDLPAILSEATLVITRAGGTTLADLACAGSPTLVTPLMDSIRDHQVINAKAYSDAGAVMTIPTLKLMGQGFLLDVARPFLTTPQMRQNLSDGIRKMARPEAAETVASRILSLTNSD